MDTDYDEGFYDIITEGSEQSAKEVVPFWGEWVMAVPPQSVVDIGCGKGVWGKAFKSYFGLSDDDILGVDGPYVTDPVIPFKPHDLREPLVLGRKYDLAICLEVAEHLPEQYADTLVKSIVDASNNVMFSAAIPFQTGHGHVNLQWPSYWFDKFAEHGYSCYDPREEFWNDTRIEPWYRQNLLYFTKGSSYWKPDMLDVVHPEIHYWGRV